MNYIFNKHTIQVKKGEGVELPKHGSEHSAGYDITAISDPEIVGTKTVWPDNTISWTNIDYIEYKTGLYIAPQSDMQIHTLIHPRSSISKYNLVLANSIGLIDNDYRGQILCRFKYVWQPEDYKIIVDSDLGIDNSVKVISDEKCEFKFSMIGKVNMNKIYKKGDKIAQLVGEITHALKFEFVEELGTTARGEGGFGHTGN